MNTARQVCKLAFTLLPKEVGHACGTCHSDAADCKVRALFSKRVWTHAQILVVGALLAPGKRTVTVVLRVMGLCQEQHFQNSHRVLNRAQWSSLALARVLLDIVVRTFVPAGPVVIGSDDALERRRGEKIKAKGIYRAPVRSSVTSIG